MERLTIQTPNNENPYDFACGINEFMYGNGAYEIINKLGPLENIEQEKGLPIPVYIALLEGEAVVTDRPRFYVKGRRQRGAKQSIELVEVLKTDFSCRKVSFTVFLKNYPFSEYGKTWAFTREELEK